METRAPKLAIAGRIVGSLLLLVCIVSWILVDDEILSREKRNIIIYCLLGISLISFVASFIASRDRVIPELGSKPSVEEQFATLESTPTAFKSSYTTTDKFGFETINSQTRNIIASIVGTQNEPNKIEVQSAFNSLSQGDIGEYSAAQASANPAPHRNAAQVFDTVILSDKNNETAKRTKIENIPLPNQQNFSTPDLSWMEEDKQFVSDLSVKEIPIPETFEKISNTLEKENVDTPNLPDIDDLLNQDLNIENVESSTINLPVLETKTPELPDIESLF